MARRHPVHGRKYRRMRDEEELVPWQLAAATETVIV